MELKQLYEQNCGANGSILRRMAYLGEIVSIFPDEKKLKGTILLEM